MNSQVIRFQLVACLGLVLMLGACTQRRLTAYEKYEYLLKDREVREDQEMPSEQDDRISQEEKWEVEDYPREESNRDRKADRNKTKVVRIAESYLGVPYRYGGTSKRGMDCSGLVYKSFQAVGKSIPRTSLQQSETGRRISMRSLRPGDLVFFKTGKSSQRINHVGIVSSVQGRKVTFIHASSSRGVKYDRLDEGYWEPLFKKAVRL